MTSQTLRRRLHHGDVDGKKCKHLESSGMDSLSEPLLGKNDQEADTDIWDDERKKEQLHWTFIFSNLIAQWAQWLANMLVESGSLIGRLLPFPFANQSGQTKNFLLPSLSPLQEERLKNLKQRLEVPFDGSSLEHQVAESHSIMLGSLKTKYTQVSYFYCRKRCSQTVMEASLSR